MQKYAVQIDTYWFIVIYLSTGSKIQKPAPEEAFLSSKTFVSKSVYGALALCKLQVYLLPLAGRTQKHAGSLLCHCTIF